METLSPDPECMRTSFSKLADELNGSQIGAGLIKVEIFSEIPVNRHDQIQATITIVFDGFPHEAIA